MEIAGGKTTFSAGLINKKRYRGQDRMVTSYYSSGIILRSLVTLHLSQELSAYLRVPGKVVRARIGENKHY
jgi:hypothetical protein